MRDIVGAGQSNGVHARLPVGASYRPPDQPHAAGRQHRQSKPKPPRPAVPGPLTGAAATGPSAPRRRRNWLAQTGWLDSATSARTGRNWKVLHNPQFRLYFFGSLTSNLGTWLQNTAQVLLAYQLTHSVFWVGLVTCAQFSGSLFLGPWAGIVADRIGGRRILISSQFFSAAVAGCLAWLQFTHTLTDLGLMLGALLLGLAFTFALPVQMAAIPRLLPEEDTEAGLAMNSVSYNMGRALAPVLSIVVISTIGFSAVFALNALSFIIFAVFLFVAHPRTRPRAVQPGPGARARAWDGMKIAARKPRIWLLLLMVAAVTLADDPVLVLGPALAHRVLGTSNAWAGYFLAALGCGTILGSFTPTKVTAADASRKSRRAAWSLLILAACILVFVRGFSPEISLLAAFLAGAAALLTGAATQALLVRQSPQYAGSVMALWAIAWAGTKPLASLLDGWLASGHGVWIAGCVMIAPAVCLSAVEICLPPATRAWLKDKHSGWREERADQPELVYASARP